MLTAEIIVVKGVTYQYVSGRFSVHTVGELGSAEKYKVSHMMCPCDTFEHTGKCDHQLVLRAVSIRQHRRELVQRAEALNIEIALLDRELDTLATPDDPFEEQRLDLVQRQRTQRTKDLL